MWWSEKIGPASVSSSTSLDQFLRVDDNFPIPRVMIAALHATLAAEANHWHRQTLRKDEKQNAYFHKHFNRILGLDELRELGGSDSEVNRKQFGISMGR